MIITFSGLDGTGKTTQIELLCSYLKDRNIKCVKRHIVNDSLAYFLNHKILKRVSSNSSKNIEKGLRNSNNKVNFFIISLIKKMFLLLDIVYFRLRYSMYKGDKSNVLLCDRYFYDEIIQAEYLGFAGKVFNNIYKKMILRPDLPILFKIESEKAYGRKPEYEFKYFEAKMSLYKKLEDKGFFKVIGPEGIEDIQENLKESINKTLE